MQQPTPRRGIQSKEQSPLPWPIDSHLKNIQNDLVEAVGGEFKANIDLVMIHLRDARNMTAGVRSNEGGALAKATILLVAAALESNLAYLSRVALTLAELRPNQYESPYHGELFHALLSAHVPEWRKQLRAAGWAVDFMLGAERQHGRGLG